MRHVLVMATAAIAISLTWCSGEYGEQSSPSDAGADAINDAGSYPDGAKVWSGNGHGYEVVAVPGGITWTTARVEAIGRGGHLVTLTSDDENTFVYLLAKDVDGAWTDFGGMRGPWIGAEQKGGPEPDGGWTWVTNEPFVFTAWYAGEPENGANSGGGGAESVVHFYAGGSKGATWNDWGPEQTVNGYVVEYE